MYDSHLAAFTARFGSYMHWCVKSVGSNPNGARLRVLTSCIWAVYLVEADPVECLQ